MSRTEEGYYLCAGPSEPTSIDETIQYINLHLRAANSGIEKLQEQLQSSRKLEKPHPGLQETEAAARAEHSALKNTLDSLSEEVKHDRAFDEQLKEEKISSDQLLATNQLLRERIGALKDKETAMRELRSKRAAMAEENKELQQQLEILLEKVPDDLEEKYTAVFKETERLYNENNDKMGQVTMLRDRYRQNAALCEAYGDMKTERRLLRQENDRLRQEIQKTGRKILHQKTFLKRIDALEASHEAVSCENAALLRELERLNTEHEKAKQFSDSYNQSLSRMEGLKKENDDLRQQIQDVSRQLQSTELLKDKCKELEAEGKSAMAQNRVLLKTYSEKRKKLAKEEAWKDKYNELKQQIKELKRGNGQTAGDIQGCNANLEDLNNLKAQHKLLKIEKKELVDQQNTLHRNLRELMKQFLKQRAQMEKNEGLVQKTKKLTTENRALWDKIETLSKSLQGENTLGITFNSLMVEKNATKQQNKALHKEVQKLTKKLDQEKRSEGMVYGSKDNKRRIQQAKPCFGNSFRR